MFKTLNNHIAERILKNAVNKQARYCAYSLYNHFLAESFTPEVFLTLFKYTTQLLGLSTYEMMYDDSIDVCVRDFIKRYYNGLNFR